MRFSRIAMTVVLLMPMVAGAQEKYRTNVYTTTALVGGVTPLRINGASESRPLAGIRGDFGFQFPKIGIGAGIRYWRMLGTSAYSGGGFEALLGGEARTGPSSLTTLRFGVGYGQENLDLPQANNRTNSYGAKGLLYSAGLGREILIPEVQLLVTADVVMPPRNLAPAYGISGPRLEIGIGMRTRTLASQ